jgi:TRAP-type C4-dicarboxylate transport system permease small subunit
MSNPLVDVLPPKYRRYAYALLSLAGLAYAAYTLAGGNWRVALGSLLASLVGGTAHANTPAPKVRRNARGAVDLGLACLVVLAVVVSLWYFGVRP